LEQTVADRVVLEISPLAGWVQDVAAGCGLEVEVASTNGEPWRWRQAKKKTDRRDALKLAQLSAMGQLSTVHVPAKAMRQWRSLIGYRQKLLTRRGAIQNRIRALLEEVGMGQTLRAGQKGWSGASRQYLKSLTRPLQDVEMEQLWRGQLGLEMEALEQVEGLIGQVESKLDALGEADERVGLLRTIPGVGPRLSEGIVAAIDDPHRFRSARQVASYAGLVPRQFQSGQTDRRGRITKQGRRWLRKLLVEVSWMGLRWNPWIRQTYQRIQGGKTSRKKLAIVAVARRLLVVAWAMLRDGTPWRPPGGPPEAPPPVTASPREEMMAFLGTAAGQ
jgi:transposase